MVGVIVAAIVLMPGAAAIRAAAHNRLQSSINLVLGSAVACIGLTVPAVAAVSFMIGQPLALGISAGQTTLLALSFAVAIITYGTGRTNLLCGIVHLVLAATTSSPSSRRDPSRGGRCRVRSVPQAAAPAIRPACLRPALTRWTLARV